MKAVQVCLFVAIGLLYVEALKLETASRTLGCRDLLPNCADLSATEPCDSPMMKDGCIKTCAYCDECTDMIPENCGRWAREGYCSQYRWVRRDCPTSCGLCGPTPVPEPCVDTGDNCERTIANHTCDVNWVRNQCAKSCGECGTSGIICEDDMNCPSLIVEPGCDKIYVQEKCPLACGKCDTDEPICEDIAVKCDEFIRNNGCTGWVLNKCRLSCGECTPEPTPVVCFPDDGVYICDDRYSSGHTNHNINYGYRDTTGLVPDEEWDMNEDGECGGDLIRNMWESGIGSADKKRDLGSAYLAYSCDTTKCTNGKPVCSLHILAFSQKAQATVLGELDDAYIRWELPDGSTAIVYPEGIFDGEEFSGWHATYSGIEFQCDETYTKAMIHSNVIPCGRDGGGSATAATGKKDNTFSFSAPCPVCDDEL